MVLEQKIIQRTNGAQLALDGQVMVDQCLDRLLLCAVIFLEIICQVFHIGRQIALRHAGEVFVRPKGQRTIRKGHTLRLEKMKERAHINGIGQAREGAGGHGDCTDKI